MAGETLLGYTTVDVAGLTPTAVVTKAQGGFRPEDLTPGMILLTPWGAAGEPLRVLAVEPTRVQVERFWIREEQWIEAPALAEIKPACAVTLPEGAWDTLHRIPDNTTVQLADGRLVFVAGQRYYDAVTQAPLVLPLFPEILQWPRLRQDPAREILAP